MENQNEHNVGSQTALCPSYDCNSGAKLFGVVNSGGFIDYLKVTLEIDESFVSEAKKGREPEKRFRFAGNCAKSGCGHWNKADHQCGLIDKIIEAVGNSQNKVLQYCPIRSKCRWFLQRGGLACAQCNEVIRNIESQMME
jgi:hypothetical protein